MERTNTELIMKLDYKKTEDIKKLLLIMQKSNIQIKEIGIDEYSLIISE